MRTSWHRAAALLLAASAALNRVCLAAAGLMLTAMLLTVGLQVLARYVFFSPPSWTEELARYFMIWAGLLGATAAFYQREDPVLMHPPQLKSTGLRVLAASVRASAVVLFLGPVLYHSVPILQHHMFRLTESTGINLAYVFVIVPLFAAVILFHLAARIFSRMVVLLTPPER
jgi:TRAP-type C4-dicarboxylate transport system permease small subunit